MNALKIILRIWCGIVVFFLFFSLLFSITSLVELLEDKNLQGSLPQIVYTAKPLKYCTFLFSVFGAILLIEPIMLLRPSWIPVLTMILFIFSCLIYGLSMLASGFGALNGPHQVSQTQLIGNGLMFLGLLGSMLWKVRKVFFVK